MTSPISYGAGGMNIASIGTGGTYQAPQSYTGGNTMQQTTSFSSGAGGGAGGAGGAGGDPLSDALNAVTGGGEKAIEGDAEKAIEGGAEKAVEKEVTPKSRWQSAFKRVAAGEGKEPARPATLKRQGASKNLLASPEMGEMPKLMLVNLNQ